jgi:glycosyltransferase involved in cell wall biosynthesis
MRTSRPVVFILGTAGVPANYGGFETLAENLIDDGNFEWHVFCPMSRYEKRIDCYKNARLHYLPIKANGVASVLYDIVSLVIAARHKPDWVLLLGVSGASVLPLIKFFFPKLRIATNIDGIEWRREKWNRFAKIFLRFSEYLAVRHSDVTICDNRCITDYVNNVYGSVAATIAYGGDHALRYDHSSPESNFGSIKFERYFLSICRIEPENNVELILKAFSESGQNLIFVGNWHSSSYGRRLKQEYAESKNLELVDPIFCAKTLYKLRSECMAYVHGHSAGGTNPSLVEIMHFGVPILAFDCAFNRETLHHNGFFFSTSNDLKDGALGSYMANQITEKHMDVARENYTWQVISRRYSNIFMKESV